MSANSDFREYENGVADILASVVGEAGNVQRNVKLPSRSGGRARQIDVLVEATTSGITNTRLIVDCKRGKKPMDVKDIEEFIGMVEDVGADMGILVSAAGASDGAMRRAQMARGVRIKALSIEELTSWRPAGTVLEHLRFHNRALKKCPKHYVKRDFACLSRTQTMSMPKLKCFATMAQRILTAKPTRLLSMSWPK